MKRILLAVAAAVGLAASAGVCRADWGGTLPPSPPSGPSCTGDGCGERFGIHPMLRKCLFWKKGGCNKGCGKAGCGPSGLGWNGVPGSGMPGSPGAAMPGTLVFPNHWYARSPRDFFMLEPNRP